MCLSNCEKLKTGKEITVYKVLLLFSEWNTGEPVFQSPYYTYKWGKIDGSVKKTEEKYPYIESQSLYDGAFHTFKKLCYADHEAKILSRNNPSFVFSLVRCTIPSDTAFLYDGDYAGDEGYASESLVLLEETDRYVMGKRYGVYEKLPRAIPKSCPVL